MADEDKKEPTVNVFKETIYSLIEIEAITAINVNISSDILAKLENRDAKEVREETWDRISKVRKDIIKRLSSDASGAESVSEETA